MAGPLHVPDSKKYTQPYTLTYLRYYKYESYLIANFELKKPFFSVLYIKRWIWRILNCVLFQIYFFFIYKWKINLDSNEDKIKVGERKLRTIESECIEKLSILQSDLHFKVVMLIKNFNIKPIRIQTEPGLRININIMFFFLQINNLESIDSFRFRLCSHSTTFK